ncbi:class I SAM-dependent methyltransferase [Streptomyces sp. HMX87]|uniref:class I SAM-dependent methyltransferase n=1 Tax=Streptomyces sp. HMX87 TaxID=3390849 RepID=UPI003A86B300
MQVDRTDASISQERWDLLWRQGRRYRPIDAAETEALRRQLGAGRGRPALDIGCGTGELTAHLTRLGHHATGIDHAPTAVAAARSAHPGIDFRLFDFDTDPPARLGHPAYAVIACRLVYRWASDKPAFLARVRRLLAPGGIFWVATSVHDPAQGTPKPWEADGADIELLTAGWSTVRVHSLTRTFRCYALRP